MKAARAARASLCASPPPGSGMAKLIQALRALPSGLRRPSRGSFLDLRTLSDHLQRDIGALDGNDPRGPRP